MGDARIQEIPTKLLVEHPENSNYMKAETARKAIEHADNYVLLTVLFASVLFFAGISSKFKSPHTRIGLLMMGWILFIGSLMVLLFQPVK